MSTQNNSNKILISIDGVPMERVTGINTLEGWVECAVYPEQFEGDVLVTKRHHGKVDVVTGGLEPWWLP